MFAASSRSLEGGDEYLDRLAEMHHQRALESVMALRYAKAMGDLAGWCWELYAMRSHRSCAKQYRRMALGMGVAT